MDPTIKKAPIDIIYNYTKHGLLHPKRWCSFCATRMRMIKTRAEFLGYIWVCPVCFDAKRVTCSTPLNTLNLLLFDFALAMWVKNATPKMAGDMSCGGHSLQALFSLFRRAYTFYLKTKILPYLVLPGPVEIDEAKIGRQRWHFRGEFPKKIKWAFGMFCRTTQIPLIYEIKCKVHKYLVSILKRHLRAGTVMHSDHHSSYVVLRSAKSLLAKYGFYHYWVNHSNLYVHEKFSFVMTGNIERVWS